jgi:nucleoside-diphosphate-sugar epimerase
MKAKNCLIFGGSGQIGRNLIRKLTKNNYQSYCSYKKYSPKELHNKNTGKCWVY